MAKKIKIAHIHVRDKKNKGDAAIVMATQELLRDYLGAIEILDFSVEFLRAVSAGDIRRLNSCDLAVVGGGGIYYHYFLPYNKNVIKQILIPIVLFGPGYIREEGARALTPAEKESVAFLNQRAALVSVRDYYSKKFLINGGVPAEKIKIIGDPAIFLRATKTPTPLLQNNKIKIGLNLNYSGWLGFGRYQNEIVSSYRAVADYFQKTHQAEIYYLKHHPGEEKIINELGIPKMIIVDMPIRRQKYIYAKMNVIIGMMLHSCVLAFGAGTPAINVGYDIRNKNFARFIGCPELCLPVEKLNSKILLQKAKDVFRQEDFYRLKFSKIKARIWRRQADFLQEIKKLTKNNFCA